MNLPPMTPDQRLAIQARAKTANDARLASWVQLDAKSRLGKDAPPGVGWRLEVVGRRDRFYATKEQATQAWGTAQGVA